jgi:16S rRNA (guanine966-N2)-methyltransferase
VADKPGLRPTPDRVRETLFNWLGQDLSGWRCLDAFAGSGALGFEAASRGAAEVLLLERDPDLARSLRSSRQRWLQADATRIECSRRAGLDGARAGRLRPVLLDPPFDAGWPERALPLALRLAKAAGTSTSKARGRWRRCRRGGCWPPWPRRSVHFQLLRRAAPDALHWPRRRRNLPACQE